MKSPVFFILILLAMVSGVAAEDKGVAETAENTTQAVEEAAEITQFVYDLFARKVWDIDWSISDHEGTPVKNTKTRGGITAWIDITGFRNMSIIDNVSYVNGEAKDFAIVKRGATYGDIDGTMTSFKSVYTVTDCNVTNTTTATQTTTLKYEECHTVHTTTDSSRDHTECTTYTSSLTVSCTVDSPENFTTRIPHVNVSVTTYNRSMSPVTTVYVPNENHSSMAGVMIVNITYNGCTVCRYDRIGEVTTNDRDAEYVLFVDGERHPLWKTENKTQVWNRGSTIVIPGNDFNTSLLNISLHTPYETKYIENITVVEKTADINIPIALIKILLLLIGSITVLVIMWKRVL